MDFQALALFTADHAVEVGGMLGVAHQRRLFCHLPSTSDSRGGNPLSQAFCPCVDQALPKEATDSHSETFELVVLLSYEVIERAPCLEETRLRVGEPAWKALDRESAEALVGQGV
jgi:hypothetical protein